MTKKYEGKIAIKTGSSTSTVIPVKGESPGPSVFKKMIESQYTTTFLRWTKSPMEDRS